MKTKEVISSEFLNVVLQPKKVPLASTIVTAADSGYFVAIQALIASLKLSHIARLVVCDLGFTQRQKRWIERQGALLFKPKLIVPKTVFFWQTWNKPFYIEQVSKIYSGSIIWIDADCIVLGSIRTFDLLTQKSFVIINDRASINYNGWKLGIENASNKPEMYKKYPVYQRLLPGEQPNAGIIGIWLRRTEDKDIHTKWSEMVRQCMKDTILFDKKAAKHVGDQKDISWHDQGCLQWAIEKCSAHHCVLGDERFNESKVLNGSQSYQDFINKFNKITAERIAHFPSGSKPYNYFPKNFNPDIIGYPANRQDLRIFVLGHKNKRAKLIGPCLEYVHLPDIDKNNDLAESRIFQSDKLLKCKQEYIGLATAQWNTKYNTRCLSLKELHSLPLRLSRVWCGAKSDRHWFYYTESTHQGMGKYLEYLINRLHIRNIEQEIPWSNNFIAHRSVLNDLQSWHWNCWGLLRAKFGNNIKYGMEGHDKTRVGSYIAERISMLFFCMRDDLEYLQIPK